MSRQIHCTLITIMWVVLLGSVMLEASPRCKTGSMACRYHSGRSEIPDMVSGKQHSTVQCD